MLKTTFLSMSVRKQDGFLKKPKTDHIERVLQLLLYVLVQPFDANYKYKALLTTLTEQRSYLSGGMPPLIQD